MRSAAAGALLLSAERANETGCISPTPLSCYHNTTAVRQLESYSYPLNVLELRTMVERAAAQVRRTHPCCQCRLPILVSLTTRG